MTDRINALTVVLDRDIREDDVQGLIDAIKYLSGVDKVTMHVANLESHIAESRARLALRKKIADLLFADD